MNNRFVISSILFAIILIFVLKGYFLWQYTNDVLNNIGPADTACISILYQLDQSCEKFLYSFVMLLCVITIQLVLNRNRAL